MKKYQISQENIKFKKWLKYFNNLHHQPLDLSLERIKCIAINLKLLFPAKVVFTVAGTNGKGTTCRILETILLAAGFRVGVYSSPHLLCYTERVRIQGKKLSIIEFNNAFSIIEKNRNKILLTYFEFGTLSALYLLKKEKLDIVILEVGLGGRLDATNIIDPSISIITNIEIDHIDKLGNTRESIGNEKAGIFRNGKSAIIGQLNIPKNIKKIANQINTPLYHNGVDWNYFIKDNYWQWQNSKIIMTNLPKPNIPLINAATALAALHYSNLNVNQHAINIGLKNACLPGRFQFICQEPRIILDVAHNLHAVHYLIHRLINLPIYNGKIRAVVAMLLDKDISSILTYMRKYIDIWYCSSLNVPRGADAEFLSQYLSKSYNFKNIHTALKKAILDSKKQDIIIIFGSFYTISKTIITLNKNKNIFYKKIKFTF
ncbi:Bifunctional protein FolC [Serratia symbiotica]|nr:Bifunctional protein FolC [Serratia symbiotica]